MSAFLLETTPAGFLLLVWALYSSNPTPFVASCCRQKFYAWPVYNLQVIAGWIYGIAIANFDSSFERERLLERRMYLGHYKSI